MLMRNKKLIWSFVWRLLVFSVVMLGAVRAAANAEPVLVPVNVHPCGGASSIADAGYDYRLIADSFIRRLNPGSGEKFIPVVPAIARKLPGVIYVNPNAKPSSLRYRNFVAAENARFGVLSATQIRASHLICARIRSALHTSGSGLKPLSSASDTEPASTRNNSQGENGQMFQTSLISRLNDFFSSGFNWIMILIAFLLGALVTLLASRKYFNDNRRMLIEQNSFGSELGQEPETEEYARMIPSEPGPIVLNTENGVSEPAASVVPLPAASEPASEKIVAENSQKFVKATFFHEVRTKQDKKKKSALTTVTKKSVRVYEGDAEQLDLPEQIQEPESAPEVLKKAS